MINARETLEIKRLRKLYSVCHATTNNVRLCVKWSKVSSAISNSNVKKQTSCNLMKKYILDATTTVSLITEQIEVVFDMVL